VTSATPNKEVFICVTVSVTDGSFESQLKMPVNATKEQLQNMGEMWITALKNAIDIHGKK